MDGLAEQFRAGKERLKMLGKPPRYYAIVRVVDDRGRAAMPEAFARNSLSAANLLIPGTVFGAGDTQEQAEGRAVLVALDLYRDGYRGPE